MSTAVRASGLTFAVKKMIDSRRPSAAVTLLQALSRGTPFEAAFQQSIYMRYE